MLRNGHMPIMLLNTFLDILKSVTMILPPAALRIFFCVGILDLVKENVVIDPHLHPYVSFFYGQRHSHLQSIF